MIIYQKTSTSLKTMRAWHFWEETWAHSNGPFGTKELAEQGLRDYCEYLNGEPEKWQQNCKERRQDG